jgi:hypothetical protein
MTPLVAVIVVVLIGILAANVVSRARAGVRSVRSHHRALDTLGHITTQRPVPGATVRGLPEGPRQAHIKILTPAVEAPPVEAPAEADIELEAEVHLPAPVASRFVLTPAPPNDLWDIAAVRELVDGPDAPDTLDEAAESEAPLSEATAAADSADEAQELDADEPTLSGVDLSDASHGSQVDGLQSNGAHTNGAQSNGAHTNGAQSNGAQSNGAQTNGAQNNGAHTNGAHTNGVQSNGVQSNGVPGNGDHTDDDRPTADGVSVRMLAIDDGAITARLEGGEAAPATVELAATHRSRLGAHVAEPPGRRGRAAGAPARSRRPDRPRRRRRIAASVVVAALAVVAVVIVLGRHHGTPAAAPPRQHATVTPTSPLTSPRTTPKVHVPRVKLISDVPGAAHYQLATGARVTLKATGPCWVEIRKTDAQGPEVYTATMVAGATESVTAPVWVRLGRPTAVAVSVGATVVSPPSIGGEPYDLLFD